MVKSYTVKQTVCVNTLFTLAGPQRVQQVLPSHVLLQRAADRELAWLHKDFDHTDQCTLLFWYTGRAWNFTDSNSATYREGDNDPCTCQYLNFNSCFGKCPLITKCSDLIEVFIFCFKILCKITCVRVYYKIFNLSAFHLCTNNSTMTKQKEFQMVLLIYKTTMLIRSQCGKSSFNDTLNFYAFRFYQQFLSHTCLYLIAV